MKVVQEDSVLCQVLHGLQQTLRPYTTNFKVIVLLSSWRLSRDTAGSKE